MAFPVTRTVGVVDDFFGTPVPDPYRWLEDGDDPEVIAWLREQAARAREYLDGLPGRDAIRAALDDVVRVPRSGLPTRRGGSWFRTSNDGTQQQDVLLVSDEPFGDARALIDPNLAEDPSTSLAAWRPSPDGALVAYSYSEAGSDWRVWRVREVATGADRPDEVRWAKFAWPAWLPDGSGFVYGAFDPPGGDEFVAANQGMRLLRHVLGAADDELVLSLPDETDVTLWPEVTEDGRWLVVLGSRGTDPTMRVWAQELGVDEEPRLVVAEPDSSWELVGSRGDELLLITDRDAPRNRLVALDVGSGEIRELIAERSNGLESAVVIDDRLLCVWLRDATARATLHDLDGGGEREIELPGLGAIGGVEGRADEPLAHLLWSTFTEPTRVLALEGGAVATAFAVPLGSSLVTEQVFVTSNDGARVPVFLVHRPDVTIGSGPHPAWLYGYGGYRVSMVPDFEPTRFAFARAGGVVAVACLRGGGEYGATWHDAGRLARKQQVFDDAIAVAEWLAATGWTTPAQLAMTGRSNGGLLAGTLLTQRPELFAAVVPEVGVLDLLRFDRWTIGWAWRSNYGDPHGDAQQFATLYAYSPLHNVRENVAYPPTMVMTSDHDDRVVPAHSIKFAARLQSVSPPDAVALLRVDAASGHKEGRSHDALVAERADVLAFLAAHTGLARAGLIFEA